MKKSQGVTVSLTIAVMFLLGGIVLIAVLLPDRMNAAAKAHPRNNGMNLFVDNVWLFFYTQLRPWRLLLGVFFTFASVARYVNVYTGNCIWW